jgi:hypothetical protein
MELENQAKLNDLDQKLIKGIFSGKKTELG